MGHHLAGRTELVDGANAVTLSGRIAFVSDGQSRSEIVIADSESGQEERIVFTRGNSWVAVFHLIQVIRELYRADELEFQTDPASPCEVCGGLGMFEDDEGNWRDCTSCVR